MRRKAVLLVVSLTLAALLAGCEGIGDAIKEIEKAWHDGWFIEPDVTQLFRILHWLGAFVAVAGYLGMRAASQWEYEETGRWATIAFGIALVPLLPSVVFNNLGRGFMPNLLSLEWIAVQLDWVFPFEGVSWTTPGTLLVTLYLPTLHNAAEAVLLFVVLLGLVLALFTDSTRPTSIAAAMFLGWLLWPPIFTAWVWLSGQITELQLGEISTKEGRDGVFIAVTWVLMIVCYLGMPLIAAIVDPVRRYIIDKKSPEADLREGFRRGVAAVTAGLGSVDVSGLYGRGASGVNQEPGYAGKPPYPGGPGGEGDVVEGEWREAGERMLPRPAHLMPGPKGEEPPDADMGPTTGKPPDEGQPPGSQPGYVPELEETEGPPQPPESPRYSEDFGEDEEKESPEGFPEHQAGVVPEEDEKEKSLLRRAEEAPGRVMAANYELQGEIAEGLAEVDPRFDPLARGLKSAAQKHRSFLPEREGDNPPEEGTAEAKRPRSRKPKRRHSSFLPELEVTDDEGQ